MDIELDNAGRICELKEDYPLEVDYGADLEETMRAGGYNDIHPDILSFASWFTDFGRKEKIQLKLLEFERSVSTEEVSAAAKSKGLRPANIFELLAFGIQYPEVQWDYPILALGSRCRNWNNEEHNERVAYPYLGYNPFGRAVLVAILRNEKKWQNFCRFAAVRLS